MLESLISDVLFAVRVLNFRGKKPTAKNEENGFEPLITHSLGLPSHLATLRMFGGVTHHRLTRPNCFSVFQQYNYKYLR